METISFKLQEDIVKQIDNMLKPLHFSNRTEFIREAIRDKLNDAEKEEIIMQLAMVKGSLKGKAKMGEEEARKLASAEIAKRFGLRLD
jgi:metal-responsive CopG/Arc/MetJ family transcriptional regulator